jgi:hypothetical protein
LKAVYHRDVVAAHRDGLLTLTGLETANQLAGVTLSTATAHSATGLAAGVLGGIEIARRSAGQFIAIDGTEYYCAQLAEKPARFVRDLTAALRLANLRAAVNLNCASAPSWVGDIGDSPLYATQGSDGRAAQSVEMADALLSAFCDCRASIQGVRVYWHLAEADFRQERSWRLQRVLRHALEGNPVTFVFDRPRGAYGLAEGLDRQHPAVLAVVGLGLPQLAQHPRVNGELNLFLEKLGSLARLAVSAGLQKREHLRQLERSSASDAAALGSGFLLDRARLVVVPVGLELVAPRLTGRGPGVEPPALELSCEIMRRLTEAIGQAGRKVHLDTCLDGTFDFSIGDRTDGVRLATADHVAGITCWHPELAVEDQLRVAGALQQAAGAGTTALFAPVHSPTAEEAAEWIAHAWQTTGIRRLQLLIQNRIERQLTFGDNDQTRSS